MSMRMVQMPRVHTTPRYFETRKGYYVTLNGKQILLARGSKDDPEVLKEAWLRFREVVIPNRPSASISIITEAEIRAVDRSAERHLRRALQILEWTGCRPVEVCRIRVEDVDTLLKEVQIGGKAVADQKVYEVLERAIYRQTGPLLRTRRGKPWSVDSLHGGFVRVRDRLGLRKELTPFAYRHAFAVKYLKQGGTAADLAAVLGISQAQVRRLYLPLLQ